MEIFTFVFVCHVLMFNFSTVDVDVNTVRT